MKRKLSLLSLLLLALTTVSCGLSAVKPSQNLKQARPALAPAPASVMKPVASDFRQRLGTSLKTMKNSLYESEAKPTTSPTNSEPVKP